MTDVISLSDVRDSRAQTAAEVEGTPAGRVTEPLIDAEWLLESAQIAASEGNWPNVTRYLRIAAALLDVALEAVP